MPYGPGEIAVDDQWDQDYEEHDGVLEEEEDIDEDALMEDIEEDIENPPDYSLPPDTGNCEDWAEEKIENARQEDDWDPKYDWDHEGPPKK